MILSFVQTESTGVLDKASSEEKGQIRPSQGGQVTVEAAASSKQTAGAFSSCGSEVQLAMSVALSKLVKVYDPQFPQL